MATKNSTVVHAPSINLNSMFDTATKNGFFYVAVAIVVYTTVLIPLSFVDGKHLKQIWSTGLFLLWLGVVACYVLHFAEYIINQRYNPRLYLAATGISILFWGIHVLLGAVLNLTPVTLYIETFYLLTVYGFLLAELLYESSIKYSNYLSQSISFAFQGARFFIVIGILNLVLRSRGILLLAQALTIDNFLTFIFEVLQLALLFILIHEALTLNLDNPRSSAYKTIKVFAVGLIALVANFIVYKDLNFWWLGVLAFLTSVFYIAYNPTQRKSNTFVYLMYCLFGLSMVLDILGIRPTVDELNKVLQSPIVIGIVVPLLPPTIAFAKTIEKLWLKKEQPGKPEASSSTDQIDNTAVDRALEEIIKDDGLSLSSIESIMAIAIIANNFDYVEKLVGYKTAFPSTDLYSYFVVYLYAARFTVEEGMIIETYAPDGTVTEQLITDSHEFAPYLIEKLPQKVGDYSVWTAFNQNHYIRRYISKQTLEERVERPPSIWARVRKWLYYALVGIIIFTLVMQLNGFVILRYVPDVLASISQWSYSRVTDLRIAFVDAFKPYETDNESLKTYYKNSFFNWYSNWVEYHDPFSDDEAIRGIALTKQMMNLYHKNDFRHRVANYHTGLYYLFLDDCDSAIPYLKQALIGETNVNTREIILTHIATCEGNEEDPDRSL